MSVLSAVFGGSTPVLPHVTWPIEPHDDESLAGFTARTCAHNALWNPSVLTRDAGLHLPNGIGYLPRVSRDLSNLATLLAVDTTWVETRRHRTLNERRGVNGQRVDFHGAALRRAHVDYNLQRVAPTAIIDQAYHREIWHVVTLPACTITGELLVDECPDPGCGMALRWIGPKGIGCCEDALCGGSISSHAPDPVPESVRQGLAMAASLILPSTKSDAVILECLPPCLREENRGDLFELAWLLGCLDHPSGPKVIFSPASIPPLFRSEVVARGAKRLLTWPSCLEEILRLSAEEDDRRSLKRVIETVRTIIRRPGTFGRPAALLTAELEGITTNGFSSILCSKLGLLTATEFSEATGLNTTRVALLQRSNQVPRVLFSEGARNIALFLPADAADVRDRTKNRLTPQAFGSYTGLGIDAVELLIAEKILPLADDPLVQALWPEAHLDRSAATDLLEQIVRKLKRGAAPAGCIRLSAALYGCPAPDKPWPAIIEALLTGQISLYHPDKVKLDIRSCLVSPQDVPTLRALPLSIVYCTRRSQWLSEADARERLSTTWHRLHSLVDIGMLTRSGWYNGQTYHRSQINVLVEGWVSTLELQAKLGLNRRSDLFSMLDDAGLHADEHALVPRNEAREKLGLPSL